MLCSELLKRKKKMFAVLAIGIAIFVAISMLRDIEDDRSISSGVKSGLSMILVSSCHC